MKLPRIAPGLRVALQLGASIALLAFLLSRLDWQRSLALLRGADLLLLACIVGIQMFDRVLMALKWRQLLQVLDNRLGAWAAIRVYYESTFVGFALPLGGLGPDIVRFVALRSRGMNPHVTLASIVMERLNGVIATLALITVGSAVLASLALRPALAEFARFSALLAGLATLVAAGCVFYPALGRGLSRMFKPLAAINSERIAKYVEAARAYSARRWTLAVNLVLAMIEQTAPVFTLWVASHALGAPLPWMVCLAVAPVAVIIQRLPLTYAGLGLREGGAAALLVALGYDYSMALVVLMTISVMFLVALLPGALAFATRERSLVDAAHARAQGQETVGAAGPAPPK
jgi:glycosyltransferase 2 family protein